MPQKQQIRSLINRLARLDASESWIGNLNPAQRSAMEYLARANRFSRSPSHAAAFLGTTRGTTTQTFKALARKGYISEERSRTDKRSISYTLTKLGLQAISALSILTESLDAIAPLELDQIESSLRAILGTAISSNGQKAFGVCRTCRYFEGRKDAGYCDLLNAALEPVEIAQICHEQIPT